MSAIIIFTGQFVFDWTYSNFVGGDALDASNQDTYHSVNQIVPLFVQKLDAGAQRKAPGTFIFN